MTDSQLTALSTLAWIVGTSAVFILLARWSDGGSWGIATAVTRGLIGWTGRDRSITGGQGADELPPIEAPRMDRLRSAEWKPAPSQAAATVGADHASEPIAELVDLGDRPLP